jgi:hypothetical protein
MNIEKNEISFVPVDQKKFIGIGRINFFTNKEWNIPALHFMVDKTSSGNYEATLLEFILVSWSETKEDAIKSLAMQTYFYLYKVIEKSGFEGLIKRVEDHVMDDYWNFYRKIEFSLAMNKNNNTIRTEIELENVGHRVILTYEFGDCVIYRTENIKPKEYFLGAGLVNFGENQKPISLEGVEVSITGIPEYNLRELANKPS